MFKFKFYPIYIIYSRNRQRMVEPIQRQAKDDLDTQERITKNIFKAAKVRGLLSATYEWDILEDLPIYKNEIENYEAQLFLILHVINGTEIGRLLLNSLNKREKVFIIPLYEYFIKHFSITTGPYSVDEGGGVRIQFSPNEFNRAYRGGKVDDLRSSILFHELVHASRKSNYRFSRTPLEGDFPDTEEFLATQLQNVFTSTTGESDYYSLYDGNFKKKEDMYQLISDTPQYLSAIKHFLATEPLAYLASQLKAPEFNPFRDFK